MPFYKKHVFFCTNLKSNGRKCCQTADAEAMFSYTKERLQALGYHGPDKVRVSKTGCLGRCLLGPNIVVYPEGAWYRYENQQDIDEIIENHLLKDQPVARLLQPEIIDKKDPC